MQLQTKNTKCGNVQNNKVHPTDVPADLLKSLRSGLGVYSSSNGTSCDCFFTDTAGIKARRRIRKHSPPISGRSLLSYPSSKLLRMCVTSLSYTFGVNTQVLFVTSSSSLSVCRELKRKKRKGVKKINMSDLKLFTAMCLVASAQAQDTGHGNTLSNCPQRTGQRRKSY